MRISPIRSLPMQSAVRSHVGCIREVNEDGYLTRSDLGIWAVADGMGGHKQGAYASSLIVKELGCIQRPGNARDLLRAVDSTLSRCHRTLVDHAAGESQICGSTIVALLVFDRDFAVVWAGDSRLYRLRKGRLDQLTHDHSYVQTLVASGKLTPDAARHHPFANRLTHAIGADKKLRLDVQDGKIDEEDLFLICSDGLTGMVDDAAIQDIMAEHNLHHAADRLIEAALTAGGRDNITVILVRPGGEVDINQTIPRL